MEQLPEALYRAADIRAADRRAAAMPGFGDGELMERAGAAALQVLRLHFPRARRLVVVCGPGDNGGDGYVLARRAREQGLDARALAVADPAGLRGDARAAFVRWQQSGGLTQAFDPATIGTTDVIVDALFGTGLDRPVDGAAGVAVECMNAANVPVVALDIASGLEADTGRVLGVAVRAALTVSFIALKVGLFTAQGREHSGQILLKDLQLPADLLDGVAPSARRLTPRALSVLLQPRVQHAHKGNAGRVLVIGGQPGMPGAVRLAGEAAYRAGAGLVTVATHASHAALVSAACPELISQAINSPGELGLLLANTTSVALGPGLGQDAWGYSLWASAVAGRKPMVLDADALNLLAREPHQNNNWVLTPHPGEAARLLDTTVGEIEADRCAAAHEIAARFGGVCVLKGSGTVIAAEDQPVLWLCDRGNPAMATGGSGDVLCGAIAALLAQGLAPLDAARAAVWAHAVAGDRAALHGDRGLMAGDLLLPLRDAVTGLVHDC